MFPKEESANEKLKRMWEEFKEMREGSQKEKVKKNLRREFEKEKVPYLVQLYWNKEKENKGLD